MNLLKWRQWYSIIFIYCFKDNCRNWPLHTIERTGHGRISSPELHFPRSWIRHWAFICSSIRPTALCQCALDTASTAVLAFPSCLFLVRRRRLFTVGLWSVVSTRCRIRWHLFLLPPPGRLCDTYLAFIFVSVSMITQNVTGKIWLKVSWTFTKLDVIRFWWSSGSASGSRIDMKDSLSVLRRKNSVKISVAIWRTQRENDLSRSYQDLILYLSRTPISWKGLSRPKNQNQCKLFPDQVQLVS